MILVVELQFTQLQKLRILKENSYFHGIRTRASLKGASTNWAKRPLLRVGEILEGSSEEETTVMYSRIKMREELGKITS